jgi:hypothetical protein
LEIVLFSWRSPRFCRWVCGTSQLLDYSSLLLGSNWWWRYATDWVHREIAPLVWQS